MAKLPGNMFYPRRGGAHPGLGYIQNRASGQVWVTWPKPFGKARSPAQAKARQDFSNAMIVIKNMEPSAQQFAREVSINAPLLPRDVLMAQLYQRAFYYVMSDGRKVFSMAAMQDVSLLVDVLF